MKLFADSKVHNCNLFYFSNFRSPHVSGRDTYVLVPDPKTGRQAQALLRPQHGTTQYAATRAAQEQKEVSPHTYTELLH